MKFYPKCDMLIDQNRYIDGDPVGHACMNRAMWSDGEYLFCDECKKMLETDINRLTPLQCAESAKTWQSDFQAFLDRRRNDFQKIENDQNFSFSTILNQKK